MPADIFDQVAAPQKDIFDQVAGDKSVRGDIFDQLSPTDMANKELAKSGLSVSAPKGGTQFSDIEAKDRREGLIGEQNPATSIAGDERQGKNIGKIYDAAIPAAEVANKYAVQPFNKMAEAGTEFGRGVGATNPSQGKTGQRTPEERSETEIGMHKAIGGVIGGTLADPRNAPFAAAGGAAPVLQKAASIGFATQMGKSAVDTAGQYGAVMDNPDVSKADKAEMVTSGLLTTAMAGMAGHGAVAEHPPIEANNPVQQATAALVRQRQHAEMASRVANGEPAVPAPPPQGPESLTPQIVDSIQKKIDSLPEHERPSAILEAHEGVSKWALQRGKFVGPDGKITIVKNPEQAEAYATKVINDHVDKLQKAAEDEAKTAAKDKQSDSRPVRGNTDRSGQGNAEAATGEVETPAQRTVREVMSRSRADLAKSPDEFVDGANKIIQDSVRHYRDLGLRDEEIRPRVEKLIGGLQGGIDKHKAVVDHLLGNAPSTTKASSAARDGDIQAKAISSGINQIEGSTLPQKETQGEKLVPIVTNEGGKISKQLADEGLHPESPIQAPTEAIAKLGGKEPDSGRKIVQPFDTVEENQELATAAAPQVASDIEAAVRGIKDTEFLRLRPQKKPQRIEQKVEGEGEPPSTIGDYGAAQLTFDTPEAKDAAIAALKKQFKMVEPIDDYVERGRQSKGGYRAASLQVLADNGSSYEIQLVPKEVQDVSAETHALYAQARDLKLENKEAEAKKLEARADEINDAAWAKFQERNDRRSAPRSETSEVLLNKLHSDLRAESDPKVKAEIQTAIDRETDLSKRDAEAKVAKPHSANRVGDYIDSLMKNRARSDAVKYTVEELGDEGVHPKTVLDAFWRDTFPNLDAKGQKQFLAQVKFQLGMEPGSTLSLNTKTGEVTKAKTWQDVTDFEADNVANLEQNEQAIVGLAHILNEREQNSATTSKPAPRIGQPEIIPPEKKADFPKGSRVSFIDRGKEKSAVVKYHSPEMGVVRLQADGEKGTRNVKLKDIMAGVKADKGAGSQPSANPEPVADLLKKDGKPLDLFHGTKSDFSQFDTSKAGASDPGLVGNAIYFTPTKEQAAHFASSPHYGKGDTSGVVRAHVNLKNPILIAEGRLPDGRRLSELHPSGISKDSANSIQRELKMAGYDGAIFTLDGEVVQVAVFDPKQIQIKERSSLNDSRPAPDGTSLSKQGVGATMEAGAKTSPALAKLSKEEQIVGATRDVYAQDEQKRQNFEQIFKSNPEALREYAKTSDEAKEFLAHFAGEGNNNANDGRRSPAKVQSITSRPAEESAVPAARDGEVGTGEAGSSAQGSVPAGTSEVKPKSQNFEQYLRDNKIEDPGSDHSTYGPSGKVSESSRKATLARKNEQFAKYGQAQREYREAVNHGEIIDPTGKVVAEKAKPDTSERDNLIRRANELERLANGGMKPRAYKKLADELRAKAGKLSSKSALDISPSRRDELKREIVELNNAADHGGLPIEQRTELRRQAFAIADKIGEIDATNYKNNEKLQDAMRDWRSGAAYIDNNGNYRMYGGDFGGKSGRIAEWNKEAKVAFANSEELGSAAKAVYPTRDEAQAKYNAKMDAREKEAIPPATAQFDAAVERTGAEVREGKPSNDFANKIRDAKDINLSADQTAALGEQFKDKPKFQREYFTSALQSALDAWKQHLGDKDFEKWSKSDAHANDKYPIQQTGQFDKSGRGITERIFPDGLRKDQLYIKVPDDGHFLVNNNPFAITKALKGATEGFSTPKAPTVRDSNKVPRAPKEFDNEKYIVQLEKELEKLRDDRNKYASSSYFDESIKAAEENLREAKSLSGKPAESENTDKRDRQAGFATAEAVNPIAFVHAAAEKLNAAYDKGIDSFIQKAHLGRSLPEVERVDPNIASLMREYNAAPQYYRTKAEAVVKDVTDGLSKEQEKGFVLLADKTSREFLAEKKNDLYQKWMNDDKTQAALEKYKVHEDELRETQKALGGATIEDDYMRRVYDKHVAGVGEGGKADQSYPRFDKVVTPQMANNKGRVASPDYYFEHGLHEFGPSFAARYVASHLKLAEHNIAANFLTKATKLTGGDELPSFIDYNGKRYFSPEAARLIKMSGSNSKEGAAIAQELGIEQLPKPSEVKQYGVYTPFTGSKLEGAAKSLAQSAATGDEAAMGKAHGILTNLGVKYLGPKEVTEAMANDAKHILPQWAQDFGKAIAPVTDAMRQNMLISGIPHIKNILRAVAQQRPIGQLDPRAWSDAWKVAFDKTLKERSLAGVNDPAFDALLKHAGMSPEGGIEYTHYLNLNFDEGAWKRAYDVIPAMKEAFADGKIAGAGKVAGEIISSPAHAVNAGMTKVVGKNWHDILFGPGGIDQKGRIWMYDRVKSELPKATDAQIADAVNDSLGRYNRAGWTDMQKDLAPFMLFPGWDYRSVNWAMKHPIRSVLPAALITLLANQVIHKLGGNKDKDKNDMKRVHARGRSFSDSFLKERMAASNPIIQMPMDYASSRMRGRQPNEAVGDALAGLGGDAGAILGMANPMISAMPEVASNKRYMGGNSPIYKKGDFKKKGAVVPRSMGGKGVEDFASYALGKVAPQTETATGVGDWATFAGRNLGVSTYPEKKR